MYCLGVSAAPATRTETRYVTADVVWFVIVIVETTADTPDGAYRVVRDDAAPAAVVAAGTACPSTLYVVAIYFPFLSVGLSAHNHERGVVYIVNACQCA